MKQCGGKPKHEHNYWYVIFGHWVGADILHLEQFASKSLDFRVGSAPNGELFMPYEVVNFLREGEKALTFRLEHQHEMYSHQKVSFSFGCSGKILKNF